MQRLSTHPNLVQFYRWSADDDGNEYVVMELVAMGSLDKILAQVRECSVGVRVWLRGWLRGLRVGVFLCG